MKLSEEMRLETMGQPHPQDSMGIAAKTLDSWADRAARLECLFEERDKLLANIKLHHPHLVPDSIARIVGREECPVCGGSGYRPKKIEDTDGSDYGSYEACHNCGGKGWIEASDKEE